MSAVVLRGDARDLPLPDASVDLIVTSPPYFGLRSYTDNVKCLRCIDMERDGRDLRQAWPDYDAHVREVHIRHYDGQVGSEATPGEYVAALVGCTREWVRVLKPCGSLFVNLGDKYAGGGMGGHKSLLGLPWRYALAVTGQLGLILRAEIIWAKPNGLPESVTDRVRRAHEQVFHFTLRPRYYSAVDEIREDYAPDTAKRYAAGYNPRAIDGKRLGIGTNLGSDTYGENPLGKLPGSVWNIPSQPLTVPPALGVDHFAAFPMELPRRIIAGWSPPGVCTACGEGRRPVADQERRVLTGSFGRYADAHGADGRTGTRKTIMSTITGYACACGEEPACRVNANGAAGSARWPSSGSPWPGGISGSAANAQAGTRLPPTRPAVVLDPFGGTGTTALLAHALGRHGISVDRSADYCRLAAWRTSDPGERARALEVPKPPPVPQGMDALF